MFVRHATNTIFPQGETAIFQRMPAHPVPGGEVPANARVQRP